MICAEVSPFCSNPLCPNHAVLVAPGTWYITKRAQSGDYIRVDRHLYTYDLHLCAVCHAAIQLVHTSP